MPVRICFVCLGNICRSPTAEGVMQALLEREGLSDRVQLDSAGTGAWHAGERADARARETARRRGLSLTSIARQFTAADFDRFDHVVAMDADNVRDLERLAPSETARARISLFRSFDPDSAAGAGVPDPYYGGDRGFDDVFDMCEAAARGLLEHLRREHAL